MVDDNKVVPKTTDLRYSFTFADGTKKEFVVKLDNETMHLVHDQEQLTPDWARLEGFSCPHCTLDESHEYCPVAVNILELVDFFKDAVSCDEIDLLIETENRSYLKHTSMQVGVSSLLGIYMATSGCPVFETLKPMVRYHLPFARPEETMYRTITMYLLAQYFLQRQGKESDWELKKLPKVFTDIFKANQNICANLRKVIKEDAVLNALVKLSSAIEFTAFKLDMNILSEIEHYFSAYFEQVD
ncbi:MAG: hypothetical protein GY853_00400 [PVC group bacterium]|nr:hypothetical protein [PVC group bacterium]